MYRSFFTGGGRVAKATSVIMACLFGIGYVVVSEQIPTRRMEPDTLPSPVMIRSEVLIPDDIRWGREKSGLVAGLRVADGMSNFATGELVAFEIWLKNKASGAVQTAALQPRTWTSRDDGTEIVLSPEYQEQHGQAAVNQIPQSYAIKLNTVQPRLVITSASPSDSEANYSVPRISEHPNLSVKARSIQVEIHGRRRRSTIQLETGAVQMEHLSKPRNRRSSIPAQIHWSSEGEALALGVSAHSNDRRWQPEVWIKNHSSDVVRLRYVSSYGAWKVEVLTGPAVVERPGFQVDGFARLRTIELAPGAATQLDGILLDPVTVGDVFRVRGQVGELITGSDKVLRVHSLTSGELAVPKFDDDEESQH